MCDNGFRTALHLAIAQSKDYDISRLLIEKGSDLNNCDIDGNSPLHTFFNETVREVVMRHGRGLENNTKNGRNRLVLHYLAWSNKSTVEDAKTVLSDPVFLTTGDDQARTPLHYAAMRGNITLAKYFLAQMPGHCKNQADHNGKSAFHYAVESKRTEILQIMEEEGLDVYKKDSTHCGVLHEAARLNKLEAVKQLIAIAGEQELKAKDINGRTPFRLAEDFHAHQVAEYLRATYGFLPGTARETQETSKIFKVLRSSHEYSDENERNKFLVFKRLKLNLAQLGAPLGIVLLSVVILIFSRRLL